MSKGTSLLDCINLFSPNDYEKKIILKNNTKKFSITKMMKKIYWVICIPKDIVSKYGKYRKFEKPKVLHILEKNIKSCYYFQ